MTWREIVDDAFFDAIQGSPAQLERRLPRTATEIIRRHQISRAEALEAQGVEAEAPTVLVGREILAPSDRGLTGAKPLGTEVGDDRVLTDAEWEAQQAKMCPRVLTELGIRLEAAGTELSCTHRPSSK